LFFVKQNQNIDSQHAVIEFNEDEYCFVIQDLNTVNGTYINDCRVQNAAVRLSEQDCIRFGFNGIPFQFVIQEHLSAVC
jgi:pSer/pThr/pTyr-binding forkhead associated (FHA) protein